MAFQITKKKMTLKTGEAAGEASPAQDAAPAPAPVVTMDVGSPAIAVSAPRKSGSWAVAAICALISAILFAILLVVQELELGSYSQPPAAFPAGQSL